MFNSKVVNVQPPQVRLQIVISSSFPLLYNNNFNQFIRQLQSHFEIYTHTSLLRCFFITLLLAVFNHSIIMALSHVHTHFLPQRSITDDDHVVTHSRLSKTQQTRTIPLYPTQKLSAFSLKFRSKRSPSFGVPHHRPNNFIRV